jgi:Ca2+-dependent lipid-binding protein
MVVEATAVDPGVILFLSFHGLRGTDLLSKSDPRATVLVGGRTVCQTEVASNVHDGAWATPIRLSGTDSLQVIKVIVVDRDVFKGHNSLGQACFYLGSVLGSPRQALRVSLRERADNPEMAMRSPTGLALPSGSGELGSIGVRAEQANPGAGMLTLQLAAAKLDKKDFGGLRSSDPYVELSRQDDSLLWFPVFRSEVIKKTSSPTWAIAVIAMDVLCQGDKSKRLKLSVMDRDHG